MATTRDLGTAGRLGRAVAAVSSAYGVAALLVAVVLDGRVRSSGVPTSGSGSVAIDVAGWAAPALVGAVLLVRRPGHPVGWVFDALGVTVATWAGSESYATYGVAVRARALTGHAEAAVVANSAFIVAFVLVALACALTPDGRHLSRRWATASQIMVVAASTWLALRLVSPAPLGRPFEAVANPWVVDIDPRPVRLAAALVTFVLMAASVVSLVVRFVRSRGDERRQLLWLAIAAVMMPALLVVAFVAALADQDVLLGASTSAIVVIVPVAAGLAVGRYHLYDVDRLLSRAAAYVVVTGSVVAMYAAVVVVVGSAIGRAAGRSAVATTVATLAAVAVGRPVYERVRDALDRRFRRRRHDAVRQVRAFVAAPPPERGIERVLQDALGDPELRVAYRDEPGARWVSEDGHPTEPVTPDAVLVERSGRVVAAVSSVHDDPGTVREVLDVAAPELDNAHLRAALAVQLEEVRASRERLADAQVAERRRIERDLHDGAQQRLLGAAAHMQAALLNGSPPRLVAALELGVREARTAVTELRALANGLHPAVLEDGGLAAALADLAARLPVSLNVSRPQRRHLPLVEATLWFVACEAVANAVKHADACTLTVGLDDVDTSLRLVVEDDGRGGADPAGAGLRGLVDRVEAAGGRITITSPPGAGTRIETEMPCGS